MGNHGLTGKLPYSLHYLDHQVMVSTENGTFTYHSKSNEFKASPKFNTFFRNNLDLRQLLIDRKENIWYFSNNKMGVYRSLEDGSYKEIFTPFLKFSHSLVPAFEHLYPYDDKNVFIGFQEGFIHYDPSFIKDYHIPFNVFIRKIKLLNPTVDSVYYYQGNKGMEEDEMQKRFRFSYKNNSLSFSFAAPFFEDPERTEFRYRLKGYDDNWSLWEARDIKEFTNLHEGKYTFEVQARNIYQNESLPDSFTFFISPPFYRSRVAYIFYTILLISAMVGNLFYFKRRLNRAKRREKLVHEKKMIAREQQFKEES